MLIFYQLRQFAESQGEGWWTLAHAEQHYANANDLHWALTDIKSCKEVEPPLYRILCVQDDFFLNDMS